MKATILITMLISTSAFASQKPNEYYIKGDKQLTKLDAMYELLKSKNATEIYKCRQVELSKKGTIKNKKKR